MSHWLHVCCQVAASWCGVRERPESGLRHRLLKLVEVRRCGVSHEVGMAMERQITRVRSKKEEAGGEKRKRRSSVYISLCSRGRPGGTTYVGEVDDRLPARPAEDIQEREREDVDGAVLAVVRQPLLAALRVLAPVPAVA